MTKPKLFLVAPEGLDPATLLNCAEAATQKAHCAVCVVTPSCTKDSVAKLQAYGLAVLLSDVEPRIVHHLKADGLHLSATTTLKDARAALKNESLGALAGVSRHAAMEIAEGGADYVAFAQKSQRSGEPIIGWWQDVTNVPAVAFDPVEPKDLAMLLPQKPDFIRPSDDMWQSVDEARRIIAALGAGLA